MPKERPKKLIVHVKLTGKPLEIVLNEKEKYDQEKRMISKGEIICKLIAKNE